MSKKNNLFVGRSGQLALMAEFLIRELNVAIPEVDIGDDIVVVRDSDDRISRVQVKTANAKELKNAEGNYSATFKLPLGQLEKGPSSLVYALVVRRNDRWEEFVMIPRSVLFNLYTNQSIGSLDGRGNLILKLSFKENSILTKNLNLHPFRSQFTPWPPSTEIPDGVLPPSELS